MSFTYRTICICKIKGAAHSYPHSLCYIPEIASIQDILPTIQKKSTSLSLKFYLKCLGNFKAKLGKGVLPLNLSLAKQFIEELYVELLKNNISLPPNHHEFELPYLIKNLNQHKNYLYTHEIKIKINLDHLGRFAKFLPRVGTFITLIMTIGLTVSSLVTILGWGWSLLLLSFFGISRLLTSYADISGGPERRLLRLGLWIDRIVSRDYAEYGKFSLPKFLLNSLVVLLLACNSFLIWYGAWQLIRCMHGMSHFPNIIVTTLAGAFAWSSAGATFGRIYQELYILLYNYFSQFFSFDEFKDEEKIKIDITLPNLAKEHSCASETGLKSLLINFNYGRLNQKESRYKTTNYPVKISQKSAKPHHI